MIQPPYTIEQCKRFASIGLPRPTPAPGQVWYQIGGDAHLIGQDGQYINLRTFKVFRLGPDGYISDGCFYCPSVEEADAFLKAVIRCEIRPGNWYYTTL